MLDFVWENSITHLLFVKRFDGVDEIVLFNEVDKISFNEIMDEHLFTFEQLRYFRFVDPFPFRRRLSCNLLNIEILLLNILLLDMKS